MTYNGNQLVKAEDVIGLINLEVSADFKNYSNVAIEYTYNKNGAMTKDLNKGISQIQYNSLNLPTLMDIKNRDGEGRNEYIYSASGVKLQVKRRWNPAHSTSPVIGSAVNVNALTETKTTDYAGNKVYEDGKLKILVDGGYIENNLYHYYLKDHLGNNRVVINQYNDQIQSSQYYPFGMTMAESTDQQTQPYKYNGKELDKTHGLNLYDYSARYYDGAIGRFTTVDPLAEKYYSISPYVYCANNPLKYIDPTGEDYVLTIDLENMTITVSATYYTTTQDLSSAQQAVNLWNEQSGLFSYKTNNGNEFKVNFDMTVSEVVTSDDMSARERKGELVKAMDKDKSGGANAYMVVPDSELAAHKNGSTSDGKFIQVKSSRSGSETGAHEIGHTLGMVHNGYGLMSTSSTDRLNNNVKETEIKDMINYPAKGIKPNQEGRGVAGKGTV